MRALRLILVAMVFVPASPALVSVTLAVHHPAGVVRGFRVLKTLDGTVLGNGDLVQDSHGDRVTSRMTLRFKDGSLQDETAVFTQNGRFHLVSDHLVQRGPAFPNESDLRIDVPDGRVVVRWKKKSGKEEVVDEKMALPDDLANGLPLTLVKNIPGGSGPWSVSMLFASPKPQLVHLVFSHDGKDSFAAAGAKYPALRYKGHIEIGGLKGVLAKLLGKQPPDASIWVSEGAAPGFVRSESQYFQGGPLWRLETAAPLLP